MKGVFLGINLPEEGKLEGHHGKPIVDEPGAGRIVRLPGEDFVTQGASVAIGRCRVEQKLYPRGQGKSSRDRAPREIRVGTSSVPESIGFILQFLVCRMKGVHPRAMS